MSTASRRLVVISGLSGAGKSTALHAFEDWGFFAVDNLPVALLKDLLKTSARHHKIALLLHIVEQQVLNDFLRLVPEIEPKPALLFVQAAKKKIVQRYQETRRPHPLFDERTDNNVGDAVQKEIALLTPLKEVVDIVMDTTNFTVHDLRREIERYISVDPKDRRRLRLNLMSFGVKHGPPSECDLIADVRLLPNPYFIPELRNKHGCEAEVAAFVLEHPDAVEFLKQYTALLKFLLPRYAHEGKSYVTIGIGCTGGRHRSVAIIEALSKEFSSAEYLISVQHRDIHRV